MPDVFYRVLNKDDDDDDDDDGLYGSPPPPPRGAGTYPGFCSMKRLGLLLLSMKVLVHWAFRSKSVYNIERLKNGIRDTKEKRARGDILGKMGREY